MTRIEECEKLLETWKAAKKVAKKNNHNHLASGIELKIEGITAALNIFKRPSNTQMQIDTKPCRFCSISKDNLYFRDENKNFCVNCGRALSD